MTVCSQCAAGTWSDAVAAVASSTCQQCPAGRFSDVPGGSELNSCQSCAKGTWSDQLGVTICQECEVGKWSDATGASSDVCQDCTAGRYGDQSGQSSLDDCLLCDPGTWSSEGLTFCYNCSAGRWSDTIGGGSISTCIACAAGRISTLVSATSIETCVACPVKTFASQSASTACEDCQPGQASFEGSSSCSDCGAGFYEGPTSCEQCPVARYSDSKQASCSQCEAGYVVNSHRTACIPCSRGRFSDTQGAEACQDCGAGRYGIQAGGISLETACQECPAGRVSNGLAVTSLAGCLQCSPGNFAGTTGGSSCEPCQAGRYQESPGQSACTFCEAGRFIGATGSSLATECEACPAGRSSTSGSGSCTDCPVGTNAVSEGQSACTECPATNETGSIGCCPGNSEQWPLSRGFSMSLPPGKSASVMHVLSNCQDKVDPLSAELAELVISDERHFEANPLSLATIRPAGIHSCIELHCGSNNTCAYVQPEETDFRPGSKLQVYAEVSRRLPEGGLTSYICPSMVSLSFAGFGCQEGALLSFGLVHLVVIFFTLFLAILVELFLRRHVDVFLEVALDISSSNELAPLPSTTELKKDVMGTLQLKTNELLPERFQAWKTNQEDKATRVQMEFQIAAIAGADIAVRESLLAKTNAHTLCGRPGDQVAQVEELYKKVDTMNWKAEGPWAKSEGLAVSRHPLAVVKEVGRLPGADLVDTMEAIGAKCVRSCCSCFCRRLPRLTEENEALRLRAAKAFLEAMMTRSASIVLCINAFVMLLLVFGLPLQAREMMTCGTGYPYSIHFAWLGGWTITSTLSNGFIFLEALKVDKVAVQEFMGRFSFSLLLRFFFAFVSVTDLYQDVTFPVISYRCGFDLWFVSTWLVILGVVVMQIFMQIFLILQCYRKWASARTPEERERYHVEGLFLALRAVDNHVLVFAVRPAVEERLGGSSCWKMKTVESRIAFSRFIFEDAEQCALQGVFLIWFESASLSDKIWIGLSTATSLSLSFTLAVQTFAEVRDWVWHRLLAVMTLNGPWILRWVMLMIMVIVYRAVSAFPWFGSCAPAEEGEPHYLSRFLYPWQFAVPSHVVQEIFFTSGVAVILSAVVTLLILLLYRRALGIVSTRRLKKSSYKFQDRLKPQESRLKSEDDEDDWLPALRKLHGDGSIDSKLASLDQKAYLLARGNSGGSKGHFVASAVAIRSELKQVAKLLKDPDNPDFKELEKMLEATLVRLECRTKALSLLADRSFRKKSLHAKAAAIQDATGAKLRLLPATALHSMKKLPRVKADGISDTEPEPKDEVEMTVDCTSALNSAAQNGAKLILVYVSHTGEDNRSPGKVQGLLEFTKWFQARAQEQRMRVELFFWIDYCCLLPTEAFAAIPLFIATCTEILVWRTPQFDRKVWPLTERLLAYCFCKGGLTPYAVDASGFDVKEVQAEVEASPAAGEDEEKIVTIWAGSTGKAPAPSDRKVAPAGTQLQMLRRQRRLMNPLDETLLDTAGLQRRVGQLVDMAASVSALEIFADRQPVDFGLTAVVELWLGPNQTLPAKSGDDLTRYAWTSDPSSPQWLSAVQVSEQDRAEKAVYAWRLKVEVKSSDASPVKTAEDNANADMEFYKDEWIPVILPHDQDASTPSPVEIARLFQEVDHIIRGKKIGRDVDLANLEKAAASLGTALCADLARALEADTCEAIQGAIKRGRGADLPKRLVAMKRLCELQLHRALATGDEADLTMALREASRLGGDDAANFKNFAAVKQKLAHLRMKRLQQQSLDVIKGDGKDLDSVMAVINVALRRSDWDRDWDQIWLEVLQEGRAQVKKMIDTAKASGQHEKVAQIFRLADKYGLRVIAAHAVSVWEDTIQAHRQDMKVLLQLCSAANMWGCKSFLSDAQEPLLTQVAELEKKWDKGGAPLARQQFKTLDKEISKLFEKVPTSLKDQIQERHDNAEAREKRLLDEAGKVIQRAESLQGAKPSRTPFKKDKKASELEMEVIQNVMGAMHEAKEWGWKKVMQKGERLLVKQVQTVLEEHELKQASPKLEEMLKAAQQHQVRESFTPILDNCLQVTKEDKKGDECLEAIKLMHLASMAEKLMLSDLRIKAVEEMKIEIEKMKSKEGAEGETQLLGFQDEAQALGDSLAVELATASLAHIEERERKKKEELQQMLQAEERLELIDADPEKTVKCVMVAEESGWKELSKQAIELYKRRVKEAKEMSVAKSNDEAIHGFRFMVRVMHSAQSMRGAVHSRIAVSAKKQVEEMMVKGSALQMFRALAWCTDVEDVHKKVQDLLTKIMKEWEENSEAAPQDVSNLHASVVELSKMSKDLETYSQQMQRLMTADKDMLAAIKDSEDHPTDVAKALEALKVVTARSASNPFQKKVEKMLSRTFEEAKQSGDRKQLELLRDKASKKISEAAAELLKSTDRLPKCLASGDWAGVCALAAEFQSTGCHAFAKDARQHLRDRIDELQTLKAESAALVVYELFTAAKQNGIDELAELLIEKLGASLPAGWATMTADSTSVRKELVTDQEVLDRIQSMVDHTFRTWGSVSVTRDRRGRSMASNLKVEEVLHVDNADNYLRYAAKRQKIRKDLENKALSGTEILPPASSAPASGKSPHIKTHEISLKGLVFHPEEPIDFDLQESWLWHGTRKEGVEGITSSDFDIKRAGSAAGTMFGRGLYFAESCMKSDEYTVADERGWYPLILCRVTCGRFFYCDWKRPFDHTDQLEDACHHKGFHCVLGDREKVSGTYREYIVFDNDQVYPEYIVWYSK